MPNLWVGYGNALVIHAGGLMSPAAAARLRARRASSRPTIPARNSSTAWRWPRAAGSTEAEKVWRDLLATAPPDAPWRGAIEERLR